MCKNLVFSKKCIDAEYLNFLQAMVVPDFELICEIMLVAEGFQDARVLARKFITLYTLCKELLSKQDHYDWGLRAIKSVLVVAGSLKVTKFFAFLLKNLTKRTFC